MDKIIIRNFLLPINIGIYEEEKNKSQNILINIELEVLNSDSNDNIKNVVDYGDVINRINKIAAVEHINLVETLAEKISSVCFTYPKVTLAKVRVEKIDIFENIDGVGVEIERKR